MLRLTPMLASSRLTLSASQPWSNSWPSGELLLVRRACLPSRQSRWTYSTTDSALTRYTQRGGSGSAAHGAGRGGGQGARHHSQATSWLAMKLEAVGS